MQSLVLAGREGSPSFVRRSARLGVLGAVFLGVFSGQGTAYASGIDVYPGSGKWVANTVADAFAELPTGMSVTGVVEGTALVGGAAVAAAPVATAASVAGAVLGTAGALNLLWHIGSGLCIDCSAPVIAAGGVNPGGSCSANSGVTCSGNVFTFGNGKTLTVTMSGGVKVGSTSGTIYVQGDINGSTVAWSRVYAPYGENPPPSCGSGTFTSGSKLCTFQVAGHAVTTAGVQFQNVDGYVLGYYYFLGSGATAPADPAPAPAAPTGAAVQINSTATCTPTAGGAATTVTSSSATFHAGDASYPPVPSGVCPSGSVRTGFSSVVHALTDTTVPDTIIVKPMTLPTTAPTAHPEWAPCYAGGAAYPCRLVLTHTASDGSTRPYDSAVDYPIFDPATDPTGMKDPGPDWSCKWGPLAVATTECRPVYTDVPVGRPNPNSQDNCDGSGFSFNPVSWVVVPLKCLFIPRQSVVQAASATVTTAWNGTALGTVSTAVSGAVAPVVALKDNTGPTSCDGPAFVIPQLPTMPHSVTLHPFSTCNSLTAYVLGIYLPIASAAIYLGGFFAGTRTLLKGFDVEQGAA